MKEIVKKYSSFVGSAISLNGTKSNDLRPGTYCYFLLDFKIKVKVYVGLSAVGY